MDELVRWLDEQLDEDERIARETAAEYGAVWTAHPRTESVSSDIEYVSVVDEPNSPIGFIAEHDPARVLREIDAKRDLLVFAKGIHDHHVTFMTGVYARLEKTLRLYALAYKDRPGYQESWRP